MMERLERSKAADAAKDRVAHDAAHESLERENNSLLKEISTRLAKLETESEEHSS